MPLPRDQVWIETAAGRFDRYRAIEVSTDIFGEATATVEIADDRAWQSLRRRFDVAQPISIVANGLPVFTGRIEATELPTNIDDGIVTQLVLRTKMADARVAGADPSVVVSGVSIRQFIVDLFRGVGIGEEQFLFTPETDRDLVTGRKAGKLPPVDLEPFKADQAKVQPTESVEQAAKRHLERHHLLMWESATGLICIGMPNDQQPPFYRFVQRSGLCNFRQARPVRDWGEVPSELWVYGGAVGKDVTRAPVKGVAVDYDLVIAANASPQAHFTRKVVLGVEGAKDLARANAQARRELMARSRRKAQWEFELDDWSFWDGSRSTPYAINTTCDVDVETHEGTELRGQFLVTACRKRVSVDEGTRCNVTAIRQGLVNPTGTP